MGLRIIAGKHRGRVLDRPPSEITRPTMDRVREALFSILTHWRGKDRIQGATVLDAFGGSGALALESLSRGADCAYIFETSPVPFKFLEKNIKALGEGDRTKLLRFDAAHPPSNVYDPATLILLDPPFYKDLAPQALKALADKGWLAPEALVAAEIQRKEPFVCPPNFEVLDERPYGNVRLLFLAFQA